MKIHALAAVAALFLAGTAHAQDRVMVSTVATCENQNAKYTSGCLQRTYQAATPAPALVAAVRRVTDCSALRWNSAEPVLWTKPANLNPAWCVNYRPNASSGSYDLWKTAAALGYPPVTAPPPPPPPPPNPTAAVLVNAGSGYTYEQFVVRWESANTVSCRGSWTPADAPPLATSGTNNIGPFLFPQRVDLTVTCVNSAGVSVMGGASVQIVAIAPACQPDTWEQFDEHVKVGVLPVSMWGEYQGIATWFCPGANGEPARQTYVYDIEKAAETGKRRLQGLISRQQIVSDCNRDCRAIPDGPLKDYMRTWAAPYTSQQLGVIQ